MEDFNRMDFRDWRWLLKLRKDIRNTNWQIEKLRNKEEIKSGRKYL